MGFGFHNCTLEGCSCKVNKNCSKMWYRTKIVRETSGRKDGEDGGTREIEKRIKPFIVRRRVAFIFSDVNL